MGSTRFQDVADIQTVARQLRAALFVSKIRPFVIFFLQFDIYIKIYKKLSVYS